VLQFGFWSRLIDAEPSSASGNAGFCSDETLRCKLDEAFTVAVGCDNSDNASVRHEICGKSKSDDWGRFIVGQTQQFHVKFEQLKHLGDMMKSAVGAQKRRCLL
jgi:hypothetical protein